MSNKNRRRAGKKTNAKRGTRNTATKPVVRTSSQEKKSGLGAKAAIALVLLLILAIVAFVLFLNSQKEKRRIHRIASNLETTISLLHGSADVEVEGKSIRITNPVFQENDLMLSVCFYNYYYDYVMPELEPEYEDYTIETFYETFERYVDREEPVDEWIDNFDYDFWDPARLEQDLKEFAVYRKFCESVKANLTNYESASADEVLSAYKEYEKTLLKDYE